MLAAKRFRRICFVVDRNALGQQAEAEFRSTKVVSVRTFADIFGLKGLADVTPESETKVHICTIQGLVKRVLFTELGNPACPPGTVSPYDRVPLPGEAPLKGDRLPKDAAPYACLNEEEMAISRSTPSAQFGA